MRLLPRPLERSARATVAALALLHAVPAAPSRARGQERAAEERGAGPVVVGPSGAPVAFTEEPAGRSSTGRSPQRRRLAAEAYGWTALLLTLVGGVFFVVTWIYTPADVGSSFDRCGASCAERTALAAIPLAGPWTTFVDPRPPSGELAALGVMQAVSFGALLSGLLMVALFPDELRNRPPLEVDASEHGASLRLRAAF